MTMDLPAILISAFILTTIPVVTMATKQNFLFESAVDGPIEFSYEKIPASECMFNRRQGILTCMEIQSYTNVTDIWTSRPATIKYIKLNCLLDGAYRNQCYCKNSSSGSNSPCQFTTFDWRILMNLTNLEVLDLSYNRIEKVHHLALVGLTNLKYLSLSNNNIKQLLSAFLCEAPRLQYLELNNLYFQTYPDNSFVCKSKFEHLQHMQIKNSNITDIPKKSLDYLPSLDTLHLNSNPLVNVYKQSFSGGMSLVQLDMSGCKISSLFPHFCDYLPKMTYLYIGENAFTVFDLDEITNCTSLKELNISHNEITRLSGEGIGLDSFQRLDVSNNKIRELNTTFKGLSSLQDLNLHNNVLVGFTNDQFSGADNLTDLNLRNNSISNNENFRSVFQKISKLQFLDLSFNSLRDIKNNTFENLTSLNYLYLGFNRLDTLNSATFSGLNALEELFIEHNELESLEDETFSKLGNLLHLDISNNNIKNTSINALAGLSKLDSLILDGNRLQSLPSGLFNPVTKATKMTFSSNKLNDLGQQTWPKLTTLNLHDNLLTRLPSSVDFERMTHFNVSHNKLEKFFGMSENLMANFGSMVTIDLSFNNISDMSPDVFKSFVQVESINMESNAIGIDLSSELFESADNLTYLNIADNEISVTGPLFTERSLRNLKVLNLSGNALVEVKPLSTNTSMYNVTKIDLSNCKIRTLYTNTFQNLVKLEDVNLSDNEIETFPPLIAGEATQFILQGNPLICACNMSWLAGHTYDIGQGIKVQVYNFKVPKCSVYTEGTKYSPHELTRHQFMCPEMTNCDSSCECFKYDIDGNVSITECRNNLNVIPSLIPKSSLAVFLDGNSFTTNNSLQALQTFENMSAVELYLNKSAIMYLTNGMFSAFTKLEILSLVNNLITIIPAGFFDKNKSLKQIFLQGNSIHTILPGVFQDMPSLKELDISGNKLEILAPKTCTELSSLASAKYFFLAGNPWVCNCSNVNFKDFVDKFQFRIRDRRALGCDKGSEIIHVPRADFTCEVDDHKSSGSKAALIVAIIVCIAIGLFLFAVLYYFRRELLSILYYKTGCHIPGKSRIPGKHFDVFINYDPNDQNCTQYIQKTILPRLKNNSYSIQTSNDVIQDFEVTKKLLEDSRCSLFVIDKNFAANSFMVHLFLAATKMQKNDKKHKLIIIIHGDIDLVSLEPEVMSRMRKGDYITSRSRLWWERLVYELPDPCSGFRPRVGSDDDEDVVVFSSLAEDQYEQI